MCVNQDPHYNRDKRFHFLESVYSIKFFTMSYLQKLCDSFVSKT